MLAFALFLLILSIFLAYFLFFFNLTIEILGRIFGTPGRFLIFVFASIFIYNALKKFGVF